MKEAFRRAHAPGVIGIFDGDSLDEVQAQVGTLPFVALGIMTFEYTEIVEI